MTTGIVFFSDSLLPDSLENDSRKLYLNLLLLSVCLHHGVPQSEFAPICHIVSDNQRAIIASERLQQGRSAAYTMRVFGTCRQPGGLRPWRGRKAVYILMTCVMWL